jgi:hypothetical protein
MLDHMPDIVHRRTPDWNRFGQQRHAERLHQGLWFRSRRVFEHQDGCAPKQGLPANSATGLRSGHDLKSSFVLPHDWVQGARVAGQGNGRQRQGSVTRQLQAIVQAHVGSGKAVNLLQLRFPPGPLRSATGLPTAYGTRDRPTQWALHAARKDATIVLPFGQMLRLDSGKSLQHPFQQPIIIRQW